MKLHSWIPALVATVLLVGCSATQARINANEDLFNTYSPEDQAAIKSNRINRGFDSTQVYLSIGKADRTEMNGEQELWFYHQIHKQTVQQEKSASEYREELSAYEHALEQGAVNLPEPQTFRVVNLYRTRVYRVVSFEAGRVVSWDEPDGMWLDDWHQ